MGSPKTQKRGGGENGSRASTFPNPGYGTQGSCLLIVIATVIVVILRQSSCVVQTGLEFIVVAHCLVFGI